MLSIARVLTAAFLVTTNVFAAAKKDESRFAPVDAAIEQAIAAKQIPGAVLLVGHKGEIVYRKAYGNREVTPRVEPMTLDTIFDMASLTKCVATGMSVMRMLELGQVRLNDPLAKYVPDFGANGKEHITLRQLLTHHSGLRPDLDLKRPWSGKETAYQLIAAEKPASAPGSEFVYSDINFEALGWLVERLSGMSLDQYAKVHIFEPLKMRDTSFLPPAEWQPRIAPTNDIETHRLLRGIVHDPTAQRMGGVAGHAGVFSTADDMARLAQALLDKKVLDPLTIEKMTTPQQPPWSPDVRGLAWDIDSPFASNRGELLPVGSYGHTGFTGTSMWIDPYTRTYIILLTNSVHPEGNSPAGGIVSLRSRVSNAVATALEIKLSDGDQQRLLSITGYNETAAASHRPEPRNGHVLNGIDVLEAGGFKELTGKRIGLLTNQSGLDAKGVRTIDVLAHAPGVRLVSIFSPEHGATGAYDEKVGDARDAATGIPITSLFKPELMGRPFPELMKGIDAFVVDLQDAGVRYYTYEDLTGYALESAAMAGVEVIVLDRPNPISGAYLQGPISSDTRSVTNYLHLPIRHGMTIGEVARYFSGEGRLGAKLTVVPMQGWKRGDWFDSTGLLWVNPSPNLRNLEQTVLYPGVSMIEGTNVSVGRGTGTPFEVVGAPWISPAGAVGLAAYLNERGIAGVRFVPMTFMPAPSGNVPALMIAPVFNGELCGGVNILLTDRYILNSPELGVELASALLKLFPNDYKIEKMPRLLLNDDTFNAIQAGEDPRMIYDRWQAPLEQFQEARAKYLLYP